MQLLELGASSPFSGAWNMKYLVRTSFKDAKNSYKAGDVLSESKVKNWKNLQSLVDSRYLEVLLEVDDNDITNSKT